MESFSSYFCSAFDTYFIFFSYCLFLYSSSFAQTCFYSICLSMEPARTLDGLRARSTILWWKKEPPRFFGIFGLLSFVIFVFHAHTIALFVYKQAILWSLFAIDDSLFSPFLLSTARQGSRNFKTGRGATRLACTDIGMLRLPAPWSLSLCPCSSLCVLSTAFSDLPYLVTWFTMHRCHLSRWFLAR